MRFYYDTEFAADDRLIRLLSIGIVNEHGDEYYAVVDRSAWGHEDWLTCLLVEPEWMRDVYAHLPIRKTGGGRWLIDPQHPDARAVKPAHIIREEVRAFINTGLPDVELWSNYGSYDHVAAAQLFGTMRDWPAGWPMFDRDLQQEAARLGWPTLPKQEDGLHNSLADARYNRQTHGFLISLEEQRRGRTHLSPSAVNPRG